MLAPPGHISVPSPISPYLCHSSSFFEPQLLQTLIGFFFSYLALNDDVSSSFSYPNVSTYLSFVWSDAYPLPGRKTLHSFGWLDYFREVLLLLALGGEGCWVSRVSIWWCHASLARNVLDLPLWLHLPRPNRWLRICFWQSKCTCSPEISLPKENLHRIE